MRAFFTKFCVLSALVWAGAAHAACDGTALPSFGGRKVVLLNDSLLFKTAKVKTDIDGAPSAYGRFDQGLEDICNGLGAIEPAQCRGVAQTGTCYRACQQAFRQWDGELRNIGKTMCSIGLGGGECSEPQPRFQQAPRQDWFVSETTVRAAPPPGVGVKSWLSSQPAQLDALEIPYFVIPGKFRAMTWDATPGDVGVVVDKASERALFFVVGDVGGNLDEASAKLLAQLRGAEALPLKNKENAFGKMVARLGQVTLDGDYRVAIFRHTSPRVPGTTRLTKTTAELPAWIEAVGREKLSAIGGVRAILECTN